MLPAPPKPRTPRAITIRGETYSTKSAAARALGISPDKIQYWIAAGQLDSMPLTRAVAQHTRPVTIAGTSFPSMGAAARHFNVNRATINKWIENGKAQYI